MDFDFQIVLTATENPRYQTEEKYLGSFLVAQYGFLRTVKFRVVR